jgi:hypothetical protein
MCLWARNSSVERGQGIQPIYTFLTPKEQLVEHDIKEKRIGKGVKTDFLGCIWL